MNVGFTRGFASSQAYADRFNNEAGILPTPGSPAAASLDHDMAPFEKNYAWLGFEARQLIIGVLDHVATIPRSRSTRSSTRAKSRMCSDAWKR